MRFFRFDADVSRPIEQFGSVNLLMARIVQTTGQVRIGCMHLGPEGTIGYHQALTPQLFLVVAGAGQVRGATPETHAISAGQAAFWEEGEWHAAATDGGMVAIVIEGEALDPAALMCTR